MAVFNDACITDAGREMMERLISEAGTMQFTGIAVGTGTYTKAEKEESSIREMTALKKLLKVYDINSVSKKEGLVILKSIIENTGFTSSQSITEIGLIANDGREAILYSVSIAEKPLNIPEYNGTYTYTVTQEAYVAISRDLKIIVTQDKGVYALAEDIQKLIKDLSYDKNNDTILITRNDDTKKDIKLSSNKSVIKLLPAGQTSITCTLEGLDSNSSISVYADVPGVGYTDIVVDGDNVTVTFEKQEQDIQVKVVVADGMV